MRSSDKQGEGKCVKETVAEGNPFSPLTCDM